ncbi:MAG: helix-turn-helix domain-containing protein, partial [Bacteroidota bacterium]
MAQVLIAFGAFQAFFLAFILFATPRAKRYQKLFGLFLFIEGFTLTERMLVDSGFIESLPHIIGISYVINFLKPPILYLTGLSIIRGDFQLRPKWILHAIPALLILIMSFPMFGLSAEEKITMASSFATYMPGYDEFNFWFFLTFYFYIGTYLFLTIKNLRVFLKNARKNEAAVWFERVLELYSIGLLAGFLYYLIRPSGLIEIPDFHLVSMLLMTFLIQSIAYKFLIKSNVWQSPNGSLQKYDASKVDEDLASIKTKLEEERIYLEDAISIDDLADTLGMKRKYVSELINQGWGKSFRELINHYRVEDAKTKIANGNGKPLNQIGMESGFNNKVSFYRAFKRITGLSPSEYQQKSKN